MSDLVERVVDAMTDAMNAEKCDSYAMARAAITTVAEWVCEAGGGNIYVRSFSRVLTDEVERSK